MRIILLTLLLIFAQLSPAVSETLVVEVSGMECINCVMAIEQAFNAQDGVVTAKADLENQTLTLDFQENDPLPKGTIKKLLENGGYELVDIKRVAD